MRPLALTMRAFGPFAGEQQLDFAALGPHRLFLIHGPTGSGKTTLLDALCFALYGETSGVERRAESMRSDHADPAQLTEVRLDFALGERVYRVHRRPRQERAKKRGEGMTIEGASATLWERTGVDKSAEGTVLATRWPEVTARVERLLGCRIEQFRQVIVLPQGRFRDLLLADSRAREAILQTLFDTSVYARIETELKGRSRALRREAERLAERRRTLLEHAGIEEADALERAITALQARYLSLDAELGRARQQEAESLLALHAGRETATKLARLDAARATLGRLEELDGEVGNQRDVLERGRRAAGLQDLDASLGAAVEAEREAGTGLARAQAIQSEAATVLSAATRTHATELARETERRRAVRHVDELQRLRTLLGALGVARETLRRCQEDADRRRAELEAHARGLEALRARRRSAVAELEILTAEPAEPALLAQRLATLERTLEHRQALEAQRRALGAARQTHAAASASLEAARSRCETLRARLETLRSAWSQGQAAILAQALETDRPCPVCGSTDHPAPARAVGELPTRTAIDAAGNALIEAESAHEEAARLEAAAGRGLAELGAGITTRELDLGGAAEETVDALEHRLRELRQALDRHTRDLAARRQGEATLADLDRQIVALDAQTDALRVAAGAAHAALEAAQATVAERSRGLPEALRDAAALDAAVAAAEAERDALEAALATARERLQEAQRQDAAAGAALGGALNEAERASAEAGRLHDRWRGRRTAAGFTDDDDFRRAGLDPNELAALAGRIDDHDRALAEARGSARAAALAAAGLDAPELERLEADAEAAALGRKTAGENAAATHASLESAARIRDRLAGIAAELVRVEAQFGVVGRLSAVANSDNPYRISFQRFVLAALLDDVLVAATQRFARMSRGRYRLQRVEAQGDRRFPGGLDLEVEDAYTGRTRPVATLSGGESFQGALALALGLAEVVQAYAGGIRLDTIFVDEGFGSLDPEALDLAVNMLIDLQASGRLVGVISHVPELKERIDVRLELRMDQAGSRARFVLP